MDIVYYIVVILLAYVLPFAGISKLFELVGEKEPKLKYKDEEATNKRAMELSGLKGWYAYIPLYNFYWWTKIVGRPAWHLVYLFIPIVNIFFVASMATDLNKTFARFSFLDNVLAVALPFVWFPYLGFSLKEKLGYIGPAFRIRKEFRKQYKAAAKEKDEKAMRKLEKEHPIPPKGIVREWADSIIFAVFAAHFIRLFLIEAYNIPTPSMEGSLLVGDFLFVSKAHYGSRAPMTPLSFPLLHNVFPITNGECYIKWPQWGYYRAPALQKVNRYDPVVFNYPEGDTVIKGKEYGYGWYGQLKSLNPVAREAERKVLWQRHKKDIVFRPVDKRDHYIKRCVGIPGDVIEVKAGDLYVNGKPQPKISGVQHEYRIKRKGDQLINAESLEDKHQCNVGRDKFGNIINANEISVHATDKVVNKIIQEMTPIIDTFYRRVYDKPTDMGALGIFPYRPKIFKWNNDHYGPITIPKKGETVELSMNNIDLYRRIISTYEGNELETSNGEIKINGVPTNEYTFQMNYYWMMGDNRHQSADSRSWGFVPEDHIVGKPLFVWLSMDGWSVRWNRLFMSATKK